MMKKLLTVTLLLAAALGLQAKVYNVRDFGAAGDGVKIDSPAINAAIEAAAAKGGGVIYFPKGVYSSYSIRLKDNITLRLDEGAVIKAAKPTAEQGYDIAEPNEWDMYQDFGHSHWKNSLIWGIGLKNLKFEGKGLIDGTDALSRGLGRQGPIAEANKAIALKECKNVTIKGISLLNSGHFSLLLTGVDNLVIDNVLCDTNRDAFDIDCCANVKITNCVVNSLNDDGIVLKSSYGLGYPKATENVLIKNCTVSGYDPGTVYYGTYGTSITAAPDRDGPTGRVKFGTESNGGFKNIRIENITFKRCRGLALETVDGALIENIKVRHLRMDDIWNSPIYIRIGDRMRGPKELPASKAHNIEISDVVVTNCDTRYALLIVGLPGNPVENVTLRDIHIQYKGGLTKEDVRLQRGANSFFFGRNSGYPEPSAHGIQPAWGLSMQHARNIKFKNVTMELMQPDEREKIFLDDVEGFVWE
ncbi:MAG: right-handed parallel beta-helix repeat-containing protein [Bacteroidales bacterium]|jgi:polygalacturonase|nr:right-handed parallel beta-helix repeat-containing protein [Bacteroidales bacterium]